MLYLVIIKQYIIFHFYTLSAISEFFCPQTTTLTKKAACDITEGFIPASISGSSEAELRCCFITLDSVVPSHSVQRSTEVNSLGTSVTMVIKNWSVKSSKSHRDSGKNDWGTFTCLPPLNKTLPRYYKHVSVLLCTCSKRAFFPWLAGSRLHQKPLLEERQQNKPGCVMKQLSVNTLPHIFWGSHRMENKAFFAPKCSPVILRVRKWSIGEAQQQCSSWCSSFSPSFHKRGGGF